MGLMVGLSDIQALYQAYLEQAKRVEQERKPGEGLFGIGKKPADDPCHERFASELEAMLKTFAGQEPDSAQIREVLLFIYEAPIAHREPASAFWMLYAVHLYTLSLIDALDQQDASSLLAKYKKWFPRWQRLPPQNKVLSALTGRAR